MTTDEVLEVDADSGEVTNMAALGNGRDVALSPLIRPAATVDECEEAFEDYQALNRRLLVETDFAMIDGKAFMCRSGLRKLAVFYGVSYEVRDRTITYGDDDRIIRAEFLVRATAPNGRYSDGWGAASAREPIGRGNKADHNLPAVAETRAKNRASADLFGLGQVSAEEIDQGVMTRSRAERHQKQDLLRRMEVLNDEQMIKLQAWWKENLERLGGLRSGDDPTGGNLRVEAIPEIEAKIDALFMEQGSEEPPF